MRLFFLLCIIGLGTGLFAQGRKNAIYMGPELNSLSSAGYFCPGMNLRAVFVISSRSSIVPSVSAFFAMQYARKPLFYPAIIGYRFSFKKSGKKYVEAGAGIVSGTDVWNTKRFTDGVWVLGMGTQIGKGKTPNEIGIKYGYTSSRDTRFLNFFFVFGIPLK